VAAHLPPGDPSSEAAREGPAAAGLAPLRLTQFGIGGILVFMTTKIKTNLYIDPALWTALRHVALDQRIPISRLVEQMIAAYLKARKKR
jgi:Ribbon-helix-helix domain